MPLLRRAYELWRELEIRVGEKLLIVTGGIDAGTEGSATVQGSLSACALHDLPHERLDAAALKRRFPGYRLAPNMIGVYQPDAGISPARTLRRRTRGRGAQALGARGSHARARAALARRTMRGVSVETDQGSYRARKLVIAAGPWARTLVPALAHRSRSPSAR